MACTAGKFQDIIGATTCKECPSGRAQPKVGQNECDECQVILISLGCDPCFFPKHARHSIISHAPQPATHRRGNTRRKMARPYANRAQVHLQRLPPAQRVVTHVKRAPTWTRWARAAHAPRESSAKREESSKPLSFSLAGTALILQAGRCTDAAQKVHVLVAMERLVKTTCPTTGEIRN